MLSGSNSKEYGIAFLCRSIISALANFKGQPPSGKAFLEQQKGMLCLLTCAQRSLDDQKLLRQKFEYAVVALRDLLC